MDDIDSIRSFAQRLKHVTKLPYCRCLQRMRKCMTLEGRQEFLVRAKRRYAELDRSDEDAVEDLEYQLGI